MRDQVNRARAAWLLAAFVCALPATATGEREARDESERWVPALGVFSGVLVQGADGELSSSDLVALDDSQRIECAGDQEGDPGRVNLRCPASGDDLLVSPFVGVTAELMTPGLRFAPGRPRFFLRGDVVPHFGFERDVAKEGAPGAMADPQKPVFSELAIAGQGSATSVKVKPLVLSAGAGIAFGLDAWERRLRIKASFEYMREEIEVNGEIKRAIRLDPGQNPLPNADPPVPGRNAEFLFVEMHGSGKKTFQGIGPGLELEVDVARAGPLILTLFVSGAAYKILGNRRVELADSVDIVDPNPLNPGPRIQDQTATAAWTFEKAPWSYRGGVGLRFRWLPE